MSVILFIIFTIIFVTLSFSTTASIDAIVIGWAIIIGAFMIALIIEFKKSK